MKYATFSLLNVTATHPDGSVDGYWIQNHVGTYQSALATAEKTRAANSGRIMVAVVEGITHTTPMLEFWTNQRRAAPWK